MGLRGTAISPRGPEDIRTMEPGIYWFWPERGEKFKIRFPSGHRRCAATEVFEKSTHSADQEPIVVSVYRKAPRGGFLYASPDLRDWPMDWAPEGGDEPFEIRVCDLPGVWVRVPDPPDLDDVIWVPHFETPCKPEDTKEVG